MNVQVLSIEPSKEKGTFNVVVSIGHELHKFTMRGETDVIADKKIHAIMGDEDFCNLFKSNQDLARQVYNLTAKVYGGEAVKLPMDIGEVYPGKLEPISILKRI